MWVSPGTSRIISCFRSRVCKQMQLNSGITLKLCKTTQPTNSLSLSQQFNGSKHLRYKNQKKSSNGCPSSVSIAKVIPIPIQRRVDLPSELRATPTNWNHNSWLKKSKHISCWFCAKIVDFFTKPIYPRFVITGATTSVSLIHSWLLAQRRVVDTS